MKMRIVLLTDGGRDSGYGHITRCTAIAEGFQRLGIQSSFLVHGDESASYLLDGYEWALTPWRDEVSNRLLDRLHLPSLTLIDSYQLTQEHFGFFETLPAPIFLDDSGYCPVSKGILVAPTAHHHRVTYCHSPTISTIKGAQFIALRPIFGEIKSPPAREQIETIFLSLGGIAQPTLLRDSLSAIHTVFPQATVHTFVPESLQKSFPDEMQVCFHSKPDLPTLAGTMASCDLAIVGGGQSSYELLALGVPSIVLSLAENQRLSVEELVERRVVVGAVQTEQEAVQKTLCRLLEEAKNRDTRFRVQESGQKLIDGEGAFRLASHIRSVLPETHLSQEAS